MGITSGIWSDTKLRKSFTSIKNGSTIYSGTPALAVGFGESREMG
jgi:hypothetical protein